LLSQTLYSAGTIEQLQEGVDALYKPIPFYAEQQPGLLVGFDHHYKIALLYATVTEGAATSKAIIALSLPLSAAWASPAQVRTVQDGHGKLSCPITDFAANSSIDPVLLVTCDKNRVLVVSANGEIREVVQPSLFSSDETVRLMNAGEDRTIAVHVDEGLVVQKVDLFEKDADPIAYEVTTEGPKVDLTDRTWRLAQTRVGGPRMALDDIVLWQLNKSAALLKLRVIEPHRGNLVTEFPVLNTDTADKIKILAFDRIKNQNIDEPIVVLYRTGSQAVSLLARTGQLAELPQTSDNDVLLSPGGGLFVVVSQLDQTSISLKPFSLTEGKLDALDCNVCGRFTLVDTTKGQTIEMTDFPIAAVRSGTRSVVIVGAFTGLQVVGLEQGKPVTQQSIAGPSGTPIAVSVGDTAGFAFGAPNMTEVSTWRFTFSDH
jgi:hypothetical protein